MSLITDVASSPLVATPIAVGVSTANIIALLPIAINVLTFAYLAVLLGHKLWVWYREWKGKQTIKDEDTLP